MRNKYPFNCQRHLLVTRRLIVQSTICLLSSTDRPQSPAVIQLLWHIELTVCLIWAVWWLTLFSVWTNQWEVTDCSFSYCKISQVNWRHCKSIEMSYYSQGPNTLQVSMELFALNRRRLCEKLRETPKLPANSVVVLQGGQGVPRYDTDVEYVFRQVSHDSFHS